MQKGDSWLKLHHHRWLIGSVRHSLEPEERATFIDLMCLAKMPPRCGFIERAEDIPYDLGWLSNFLVVPIDVLCSTIVKCVVQERIEVMPSGVMRMINWTSYQDIPEDKRRPEGRELELQQRKQLQRLMNAYEGDTMEHTLSRIRFVNQETGELLPYVPYQTDKITYAGQPRQHSVDVIETADSDKNDGNQRTFIDTASGQVLHPQKHVPRPRGNSKHPKPKNDDKSKNKEEEQIKNKNNKTGKK